AQNLENPNIPFVERYTFNLSSFDHNSHVGSACKEIKVNFDGPLEAYFKGETIHVSGAPETNIVEANMYIAEDHI
ncbi:6169_t:CDS:2, partial [Gigaspora margarita]